MSKEGKKAPRLVGTHFGEMRCDNMAKKQSRKDSKGRVLYKGEYERLDGRYVFQYIDVNGKRQSKYANDLPQLREYEKEICRDSYDGIDTHIGRSITLNAAFDRYI